MFKCPHCSHKSNKVELLTNELASVRWLNPEIKGDEIIDLGEEYEHEGGFAIEERPYEVICKKCGEVIKEI